jgi:hypothetical protein
MSTAEEPTQRLQKKPIPHFGQVRPVTLETRPTLERVRVHAPKPRCLLHAYPNSPFLFKVKYPYTNIDSWMSISINATSNSTTRKLSDASNRCCPFSRSNIIARCKRWKNPSSKSLSTWNKSSGSSSKSSQMLGTDLWVSTKAMRSKIYPR